MNATLNAPVASETADAAITSLKSMVTLAELWNPDPLTLMEVPG